MRYVFGFLCVCALGVVPLVGCMDFDIFEEGCEGMVCDDDNECTEDGCSSWGFGSLGCHYDPVDDGMACTFDGLAGVCLGGLCGAEHLCDGVVYGSSATSVITPRSGNALLIARTAVGTKPASL